MLKKWLKDEWHQFVLLYHYSSSLEKLEILCKKQPRAMQGLEQEREVTKKDLGATVLGRVCWMDRSEPHPCCSCPLSQPSWHAIFPAAPWTYQEHSHFTAFALVLLPAQEWASPRYLHGSTISLHHSSSLSDTRSSFLGYLEMLTSSEAINYPNTIESQGTSICWIIAAIEMTWFPPICNCMRGHPHGSLPIQVTAPMSPAWRRLP